MPVSPITTHVLDTASGHPATGLPITISIEDNGQWKQVGKGETNADGRITDLLPHDKPLKAARYLMHFDTGTYFRKKSIQGFYPYVEVVFEIKQTTQHYHVPLLLSPFGFSTYRGS
jgi:5-hydroxyisourate hydrolase